MDVQTTPTSSRAEHQESSSILIDQGELRSILFNLSHELCRPLASLRTGFDLLLGESPSTITPDQRGHLLTMVSLCDDLLKLTRSYLDYAGIIQGSRPLCLGSFTVGALMSEIDRQFAPSAAARQVDWISRPNRRTPWWSPTHHAGSKSSATSSLTPSSTRRREGK